MGATFFLDHGLLAVFDPARRVAPAAASPEDLQPWFDARALVCCVEDARPVRARVVFGSIPEGLHTGELLVASGRVAVGSVGALATGEAPVEVDADRGAWEVGVEVDGDVYTVFMAPLVGFARPAGSGEIFARSEVSLVPPVRVGPVPVVEQLGVGAGLLVHWLKEAGAAVRKTLGLPRGRLVVGAFDVQPWDGSDVDLPRLLVTGERVDGWVSRMFPSDARGDVVVYVQDVREGRPRRCLRVSLRDGGVVDAGLLLPHAQSANDVTEVERCVREGFTAARPLPLGVPRGPVACDVEWDEGKLVVRVGPMPHGRRFPVRVTLIDRSGRVLGEVEALPLWHRDGRWEYEVWLLEPLDRATAVDVELPEDAVGT
ncbi:MAG: hypothetical protein KC656_04530 [Myxococcales bacterium]|nr:hypothetical protein [Myxococcales bacterium]MCB9670160.1 hypothetical protein [Alphaproteobacteria bacterium]MCB9693601.1 hypothetical protein [Alphaproteobacteria bacterium]